MGRRSTVVAALAAATLISATVTAGAQEGPPAGLHDALRLEVLSGPAEYVSGGAARLRVVVPESAPLTDATVTFNGADVTASFGPDDQAAHALEGVLRGLPLG